MKQILYTHIACIILATVQVAQGSGQEFGSEDTFIKVPRPCKNYPHDGYLGVKPYSLLGICGSIAPFQALCAGMRAAARGQGLIVSNKYGSDRVAAHMQHYLTTHGLDNKPFDIGPILRFSVAIASDGDVDASYFKDQIEALTWKTVTEGQAVQPVIRFFDSRAMEALRAGPTWQQLCADEPSKSPPAIIAVAMNQNIRVNSKFNYFFRCSTREEALAAHDHSYVPYVFKVEGAGTETSPRYYELAGVCQVHRYRLLPARDTWTRKIGQRAFRKSWLPSSLIMEEISTPWNTHVDSYVRYGQQWYVMDDETRWKATVAEKPGNGTTLQAKRQMVVGNMLLKAYPGVPNLLVYSQIDKDSYEQLHADQSVSDTHMLELHRDTPITWQTKAKITAALCAGAALDAFCLGLSAAGCAKLCGVKNEDARKVGSFVGGMVCTASMWYHARHLAPLFHTKKQYVSNIPGLGPREPLI